MWRFISAGSIQLLVGPASAGSTEQMKVRSSTRATSRRVGAGPERVRASSPGRAGPACPASTSSSVSRCHSAVGAVAPHDAVGGGEVGDLTDPGQQPGVAVGASAMDRIEFTGRSSHELLLVVDADPCHRSDARPLVGAAAMTCRSAAQRKPGVKRCESCIRGPLVPVARAQGIRAQRPSFAPGRSVARDQLTPAALIAIFGRDRCRAWPALRAKIRDRRPVAAGMTGDRVAAGAQVTRYARGRDPDQLRPAPAGCSADSYERFAHLIHELGKFGVVGAIATSSTSAIFNVPAQLPRRAGHRQGRLHGYRSDARLPGQPVLDLAPPRTRGLRREYLLYFVFNLVGLLHQAGLPVDQPLRLGAIWPGASPADWPTTSPATSSETGSRPSSASGPTGGSSSARPGNR